MARVNVYLPDQLAEAVKEADLNVSMLARRALEAALAEQHTDRWLDDVAALRRTGIVHAEVVEAVHAARRELGS